LIDKFKEEGEYEG